MNREELLKIAKPVLFNTQMVIAILEGRKTVTRRVVKPANPFNRQDYKQGSGLWIDGYRKDDEPNGHIKDYSVSACWLPKKVYIERYAPYKVNDILYVRETWHACKGKYIYKAGFNKGLDSLPLVKWRPSIHMPKKAARIFLKVTDVRVERLQDITEEQALAEGVPEDYPMNEVYCPECRGEGLVGALSSNLGFMEVDCHYCDTATKRFLNLWNSTIKKADLDTYGWEANPWVWVIEFERVEV